MDETIEALEAAIAELEHELDQSRLTDGTAVPSPAKPDLLQRIADMDSLLARLHASGVRFGRGRSV
jgi:hypothetical protein